MGEQRDDQGTTKRAPDAEAEGASQTSGAGEGASDEDTRAARDELFEALDHFRNAANMFFDRATNDPKVRQATGEAEKVFNRIGERAEPLARQLSGELSKLTKRITDTYHETVEGRRNRGSEPPSDKE